METNLQKWTETELTPLSSQRREAVWIVVYGLDKFYLTNEEKEYLISSLEKGAKFVQIKGNVLTDKFMYISVDDEMYNELKRKEPPTWKPEEPSPEQIRESDKAREKTRKILQERGIL